MSELLSLVYPFRYGGANSIELRYSLRSFDKWAGAQIEDAHLIGDDHPDFYFGDRIPFTQDKKMNSVCNVLHKLRVACHSPKITEDFIYTNDDVTLLAAMPMGHMYMSNSPLREDHSIHHKGFQLTFDQLDRMNIKRPYKDYELHAPCIYNKTKVLELMDKIDIKLPYSFRTLYWNIHAIDPKPTKDTKVFKWLLPAKDAWFANTNDTALDSPDYKKWMNIAFPEKSRWEA